MTAYCHLLSIRGEPTDIIFRKSFLFLICPGSIIIQYILAAVALAGTYILVRFTSLFARSTSCQPSPLLQASLQRGHVILFGNIYRDPSESILQSGDKASLPKNIGRVFVVLVFATQCIGSCFLFARRHQHDAASLSDWRVVELAVGSLFVTILTVVYLLYESRLSLSPRNKLDLSHNDRRTYLDAAMLCLRDVPAPTDSPSCSKDTLIQLLPKLLVNGLIAIGISCIQPCMLKSREVLLTILSFFLSRGVIRALDGTWGMAIDDGEFSSTVEVMSSLPQVTLLLTSSLSAILVLNKVGQGPLREWKSISSWKAPLPLLADMLRGLLFLIFLTALMFLCLVVLLAACSYFYLFFFHIINVVEELRTLAAWPTDLECPLLWSDPKANFIWNLM